MDSSSLPGRFFQANPYRWVSLLGGVIALLTLTIPPTIITYYSANNPLETVFPTPSLNTEAQPRSVIEKRD